MIKKSKREPKLVELPIKNGGLAGLYVPELDFKENKRCYICGIVLSVKPQSHPMRCMCCKTK